MALRLATNLQVIEVGANAIGSGLLGCFNQSRLPRSGSAGIRNSRAKPLRWGFFFFSFGGELCAPDHTALRISPDGVDRQFFYGKPGQEWMVTDCHHSGPASGSSPEENQP